MKNILEHKRYSKVSSVMALLLLTAVTLTSCDFEYDLPEANSKPDETPPNANFSASVTEDYLTYTFANSSTSATDYAWDYGDGNTSDGVDGENTFPDEGIYTVTLTASDKLGVKSSFSLDVEVKKPPTPVAITPEIINGDFEDSTTGWKPSAFTGASKNGFNGSSDGSFFLYDGTEVSSKTKGAKYTTSTTMVPFGSSTRAGYQEITVTPNTEYAFEFVYSINTSNPVNGEEQVIVEILDGHFPDDAADAYASSTSTEGPLGKGVGTVANGKGNFERVTSTFTSNATGKVSIWMYGITTTNDVWVDNVKVYPAE